GVQFGTVVTLPVSGWLCATNFLGGWPSVFYIFGGLGLVWGVFWFWLVRNDPQEHPRISAPDNNMCTLRINILFYIYQEIQPIPWKAIFTSKYFWVISIMHFGNNWGFYTLLSELPTYLDQILHINIKNNGMLSALPYLGTWLFSFLFSFTSHRLLNRGHITILSIRRWAMIIGGYGPMLCLLALCFVNCHSYWAFAFLILSGTANGGVYSGYMCSHADISPRFAGTLMGLTNTIATIPGFLGPTVTGALTQDNVSSNAWNRTHLVMSI
ncbi:UNVERIFIED_CONTAM: hypothetical protein GTU68_012443, partial [Idotea baltica]|nr:hypothetical protein [Idotea baltica]